MHQVITVIMREENLLLGRYGKKDEMNTADDYYDGSAIPIKKVSGSDVLPDNESGIFDDFRSEY